MGIEIEGQSLETHQKIKNRELQQESIKKLNEVSDLVDNINIDNIELDTAEIKNMVYNNLENQTNIDDIAESIEKISKGISDIKRNQTNMNKKLNELQEKVGE